MYLGARYKVKVAVIHLITLSALDSYTLRVTCFILVNLVTMIVYKIVKREVAPSAKCQSAFQS